MSNPEPSARQVLDAVLHAQGQITAARGEAISAADVKVAIELGIRAAVSDPQVWSAAIAAMQQRAKVEAGGWLFGGLKAAASKLAWIVTIGLGVYLIGGWSGLVALIKSGAHQ